MAAFDHFREFENFLEGVGLPAEWTPHFNESYQHVEATIAAPRASRADSATPATCPRHEIRLGTPFSYWLPSAPPSNSNVVPSDAQSNGKLCPLMISCQPVYTYLNTIRSQSEASRYLRARAVQGQ